ncbi:MAG TPA: cupin domain-containing protein [Acidobacteriaceae bacterium]
MRIPVVLLGLLVAGCVPVLVAQDAAKVDSAHYKVISENSQVRVLRVHYGPHEKSVMHSHPDSVVVYLTAGKTEFHYPGGKTEIVNGKAGNAVFTPHTVHQPENLSDHPMDAIVIELKK